MKKILILTILSIFAIVGKAQNLIGSTETTITDSMKNQDSFNQGAKHDDNGSLILTYLNLMHKDGTFKLNDDFQLVSSQFVIKNDKCIMIAYVYKDELLDKYMTTFNSDTTTYKKASDYQWTDKKNNISIKLTRLLEQKFFMVQYELVH